MSELHAVLSELNEWLSAHVCVALSAALLDDARTFLSTFQRSWKLLSPAVAADARQTSSISLTLNYNKWLETIGIDTSDLQHYVI